MHLPAILGAWGSPPDKPAWWALGAAAGVLMVGFAASRKTGRRSRSFTELAALSFAAALLSLGYVAFYLRGGPRIIDATSYFLQARALSEGHFAWHVPDPTASFRGRFLLFHDGEVAGIFPPGYPLLLSLGFAVGAPLVVGPILAGGIVVTTWMLGAELAREAKLDERARLDVAFGAACLSLVCAALRYHTADTMAHGACALAFALALLAALRARRDDLPWFFLLAGAALGFVVATRFASAIALGAVLVWLAGGSRRRASAFAACALGAIPGVALLLIAESASTGHVLTTAQSAYYAASDGPPGCFRYGFGRGIGCLVEHGEFVRARATDGYGVLSALGVTGRRLRTHLEDVANFEPLALLVFVPLARATWRTLGVRACVFALGAVVLAYVPFYFDGDYPGGGARFLADALPAEHALLALGIALLAQSEPARLRAGATVLALALAGFAVHAAYDHEQLRMRDGGSPMFDREILADHAVGLMPKDGSPPHPALVFVETDHGFDLGHDPEAAERAEEAIERGEKPTGLVVARLRNDDHDRLLYERLGRPASWIYRFLPEAPGTPAQAASLRRETARGELQPWTPNVTGVAAETWTFESENEWPPFAQTGGAWAEPVWVTDTCASPSGSGRALALHPPLGALGRAVETIGAVTIALPIPKAGAWRVTPRFLLDGPGASLGVEIHTIQGAVLARWAPGDIPSGSGQSARRTCLDAPTKVIQRADGDEVLVTLSVGARPDKPGAGNDAPHLVALDRITLAATAR